MLTVFTDLAFYNHNPGRWHPESPARLDAVLEACKSVSGIQLINECRPANRKEIELIHSARYFNYISNIEVLDNEPIMIDPDTGFSEGSFEAALKAVGAVIDAVKFVFSGDGNRAFCAVRPPGHHAEKDTSKGFCIFNNIAIGAAYAVVNGSAGKVAIIDWDVHHGNGTQNAFYDRSDVFYISLHQFPYYPGSGSVSEKGAGDGKGYNLNIPIRFGSSDEDYRQTFNSTILPALDDYRPELIMISAGFDTHMNDPLAGIDLSSEMYGEMTRHLTGIADKYCHGRIVSVLEGGYSMHVLKSSVTNHLKELINE